MRTPFFWISLGFGAGAVLGLSGADLPLKMYPGICLAILGVLFWLRGKRVFLPLFILLLMFLGSAHARFYEMRKSEEKKVWEFLPEEFQSKQDKAFYILDGEVVSNPEYRLRGKRKTLSFVLRAKRVLVKSGKRFQRREVSGKVQVFLFQPPSLPSPGDQVRCYGFLGRPRPALNPEEFNYARYLGDRGIHAIFRGYGRSLKIILPNTSWMKNIPWRVRSWVQRRLEILFTGDVQAVLDALITGYQKNITDSLRDDFVKTGTAHLLAVSGLNITLVAGSFFGVLRLLGLGQRLAALGSLGIVIFYAALAGFGVPVLRAAWMATAVLVGMLLGRTSRTLNAFFLAFTCMVLVDPGNLRGIGCQLSYLSVLGLMIFGGLSDESNFLGGRVFRGTLAAMLMTLPLSLHYFHVVSLSGILANVLAIPLFHLALMLGFLSLILGSVPWLGAGCIRLTQDCMNLGFLWMDVLSQIPGSYGYFGSPVLWQWMGYYGSLLWITLLRMRSGFKKNKSSERPPLVWFRRVLWGIWAVSLLGMVLPKQLPDAECVIFSAGQNELVYLRSPSRRHYLIHSGRNFPSDQSRWILHSFLKSRSVHELEAVFLTDFYRKHTGGLGGLTDNFKIKSVFYPRGLFSKTLFIQKPYSYRPQPVGMELELEANLKIKWLGLFRSQGLLQIEMAGLRFLYLPVLVPETLKMLESAFSGPDSFTVLMLSSSAALPDERGVAYFFQQGVDLWVSNRMNVGAKNDRSVIELEKSGALLVSAVRKRKGILQQGSQNSDSEYIQVNVDARTIREGLILSQKREIKKTGATT